MTHQDLYQCRIVGREWRVWVKLSFASGQHDTRTPDELCIVCSQDNVPDNIQSEAGWRCLRVAGPLDLSMVGVIASLSGTLAAASISVFVVSTFDTDFLLVKEDDLVAAVESLVAAGNWCRNM